jgi:galactokinase
MRALAQAFHLTLTPTELPTLAQKVENFVVGAPCGLMDPLACHLGEPNHFLPIVCQPDLVESLIPIPQGLNFVGIDSGVKHAVSGHQYGTVRSAAFMGYSIIASHLGASTHDLKHALQTGERNHLPFRGYLCNISVNEFELLRNILPAKLSGKDFLEKYVSIDPVTKINPDSVYTVRTCTEHPVYENNRVSQFRSLLNAYTQQASEQTKTLTALGNLMYAAHESYSRCGLGSDRTNEIVALAKKSEGIYGAKITGGGQGGTVCLLTDTVGKQTAKALHQSLCEKYNQPLVWF